MSVMATSPDGQGRVADVAETGGDQRVVGVGLPAGAAGGAEVAVTDAGQRSSLSHAAVMNGANVSAPGSTPVGEYAVLTTPRTCPAPLVSGAPPELRKAPAAARGRVGNWRG